MRLTDKQIYDRLSELETIKVPKKDYPEIKRAYNILMDSPANKNLSELEQRSLVDGLAWNISKNKVSTGEAILSSSNVKHINYFDNFLGQGESDAVMNALSDYGINPDVLKIVGAGVSLDNAHAGSGVTITQLFDETESLILREFTIKLNGEIIYSYTKKRDLSNIDYESMGYESLYEYVLDNMSQEGVSSRVKSARAGTVNLSNGIKVKRWVSENDVIFYTYGNRRVKI